MSPKHIPPRRKSKPAPAKRNAKANHIHSHKENSPGCVPRPIKLPVGDPCENALRQQYGPPFFKNSFGTINGINEPYWAGLFANEHIILFEPDEGIFYRYNHSNGLYEVESVDAIRKKLSARILEMARRQRAFGLVKHRKATTLNQVIQHLRGIVERRGAFAERGNFIHVANGVIVFNGAEMELRPFSPEFRSRNGSPIKFDRAARCDRFLNELVKPAVHAEDVALLQKFFGMLLLGRNRAQRILILYGAGGRGKTQLANIMQALIGMMNVTQLRTAQLGERFEIFRFLKKTLLVGVDVEAHFLNTKGAAVLKGLVGGDWFDAEQKGGTGCFQMQGNFNVVITSNTRLRVRLQGDLSAWRRRVTIVCFEGPAPTKKVADFGAVLMREEGSGILNWALEGARMVLREIPDEGGDFILTERQSSVVDSLLAESDSLRSFLQERLVRAADKDLTVHELLEAYATYCRAKGWQPLPQRAVQTTLETLMLGIHQVAKRHDISRDGSNHRGFKGVMFSDIDPPMPPPISTVPASTP
jgi:P4 family phage/plasmid primase-like protien